MFGLIILLRLLKKPVFHPSLHGGLDSLSTKLANFAANREKRGFCCIPNDMAKKIELCYLSGRLV